MGILRSIESRLERVVEGSVGRLFRASVAPVELARKLAKELEEGKVVSVTQTYAPNEYTVFLSPRDRTRFAEFEASLRNELASYLAEHARRAGYVMPTRPRVRFETESSLHTGIFGISTALVRDDDSPIEPLEAPGAAAAGAVGAAAAFSATPEPSADPGPPPFPVAMPEEPVRSPLDPDPSEAGPPGFPVYPLEPDPEPEPVAESEPEPVAESEPSFSPHLPTHRHSCPACRCTRTCRCPPWCRSRRCRCPTCRRWRRSRMRRRSRRAIPTFRLNLPSPSPSRRRCRSWRAGSICPSTRRSRRP